MAALTYLRAKLVRLYPKPDQVRRLLHDAGLDAARVDLDGAAEERWFRVLEEAEKQGALERVLAVAREEYPAHASTLVLQPAGAPARTPERPAPGRTEAAEPAPPAASVSAAGDDVDFFVSYTARDKNWAVWIAWALERAGYRCVIQAWDFVPGSRFVLEMQRAAVTARQTLAVLSPDYFQSSYAALEWEAALTRDPDGGKRKLVPVRVRECDPPGLLRSIVYIDLVGLAELQATTALLEGLANSRGERRAPQEPAFPPERVSARGSRDVPGAPAETRPVFPSARAPA